MSETATSSVARPTNRRAAAAEAVGPFTFDVGDGFTVTVTATGAAPDVKAVKNALERATRTARKAFDSGVADAAGLSALLAAIAEAERLAKATKEANDRVRSALGARKDPTADSASLPSAPNAQV